jgi:hypothetical protein
MYLSVQKRDVPDAPVDERVGQPDDAARGTPELGNSLLTTPGSVRKLRRYLGLAVVKVS